MAANRIKGITIEIGGDTTKLQTALKDVNTQVKSTQQQLKDVEKLLKLDPGNTDLLAQKQRLLGEAVAATKEKLETLKTAAEQANTALANGDISKEQYDALQREIIETEKDLEALEKQANEYATALQSIAAKGEKLKTVGDNISNVGQKFLPVTAGVAGLGTAAVKTAADFDSAMSQVAAVSGATGSELDALREKAREMGSKTKFSASEAAEAMNYMAMAGWKTEDMLSGIEGVMNLAAASGEDLATTSDIVTDALTAFGLSAQDSGHFADNSSGDATMKWIKIKKDDLTFTEGTWTLTNAHLRAIGSFKIDSYVNRSVRGVIRNGYLYLQNYDCDGVYKINLSNVTDITLIQLGFTSANRTLSGSSTSQTYMALINDFIIAYDFIITANDTVIPLAGASRFPYIGTPLFQYKEFLTGFGGNYGTDCHTTWLLMPYLASINNLAQAIVKNADKTMKITYTLTEVEEVS